MSTIPSEVAALVEHFARNRDELRSPAYNEAQVRREFIDPFFRALGWDVDNTQGPAMAKTTHEKTIIQKQIDLADRQIDRFAHKLCGLMGEEIRIVEEVP